MELLQPQFEQPVVIEVGAIAADTLQTWVNRSIVRLSAQNPGSGRRRLYSAADVVKLAIMGRLSRFGIPGGTSAQAAELIVGELVRRGEIEWQLHLAFHALTSEDHAFTCEVVTYPPLGKFNPSSGDARDMRVSDFTEVFEGVFRRRVHGDNHRVDPEARDNLARRGIHAEPCLIFPVGELVNAALLRLEDIAAKAPK
jgi:hypothetical protein